MYLGSYVMNSTELNSSLFQCSFSSFSLSLTRSLSLPSHIKSWKRNPLFARMSLLGALRVFSQVWFFTFVCPLPCLFFTLILTKLVTFTLFFSIPFYCILHCTYCSLSFSLSLLLSLSFSRSHAVHLAKCTDQRTRQGNALGINYVNSLNP